jgi:Tfp pilus assembly protein PilF
MPFALAALTFLVFSPALLNGFVEWDDQVNLLQNPNYQGLGWQQIRWMFTSTLMGHYIPSTWLTFSLDYTLWGMNPFGYHLTNNVIHAANAALFFLVALRLLGKATALTGSALRSSSAVAALFFALHPLRAESVAWATERRDVLAGLFFLLTVLMYLEASEADGRRRSRLLVGSMACYVLALLSKSIVMTLPAVLILLDIYPLGRLSSRWGMWRDAAQRSVLKEKLAYLVLGFAGALTAYWAVASHRYLTDMTKFGWSGRLTIATYSLWFYLEKTLLPLSLSPVHELPAMVSPSELRFAVGWIAVIAISVATLALRQRWPAGLALWAYYIIILGPVSGLVHAGHQITHDRYSYISCLGWALLFGAVVGSIARIAATRAARPALIRAAAGTAAAWILALGWLVWQQVQVWRDTETLWSFAVEADPRCSICQNNLGTTFSRRNLFGLAKERYELALALRPDRFYVHGNLGVVLHRLGNRDAAMTHFTIALTRQPDSAAVLTNIASVLLDQKSYGEALRYFEHAVRVDPGSVPGLVNLGDALIKTGRPDAGVPYLLRAREIRPGEPVIYLNLTRAYLALRQYEPARQAYETLSKLDATLAREIKPTALHAGL